PAVPAPSPSPPTWRAAAPTSCSAPASPTPAGCTSSAPSATSRAASTTSSAADRIGRLMDSLQVEPIEHRWVAGSIEGAQKKVEGMNFDARKHVVEYD